MPIYEYSCKKCGERIEVIQKMSDPELKKHKGCGGTLTKEISASAFHLKGTGWYVTDYARKGQTGEESGAPKDATGKEGKKEEGKPAETTAATKDSGSTTEAKPAEKKPAKPSAKKD